MAVIYYIVNDNLVDYHGHKYIYRIIHTSTYYSSRLMSDSDAAIQIDDNGDAKWLKNRYNGDCTAPIDDETLMLVKLSSVEYT